MSPTKKIEPKKNWVTFLALCRQCYARNTYHLHLRSIVPTMVGSKNFISCSRIPCFRRDCLFAIHVNAVNRHWMMRMQISIEIFSSHVSTYPVLTTNIPTKSQFHEPTERAHQTVKLMLLYSTVSTLKPLQ